MVLGEQRGEGVRYVSLGPLLLILKMSFRMGCRCLWDAGIDCYASETFVNVRVGERASGSPLRLFLGQLILRRSGVCGVPVLRKE